MATFKKFDNQQVYKLKTEAAVNLKTETSYWLVLNS